MHRMRIATNLRRDADYIKLITGSGDIDAPAPTMLPPAKTFGGKPLRQLRTFTEDDLIASDDKVHQLRKQVEAAEKLFIEEQDPAALIASLTDVVIRGVAKKAGLPFSLKDVPKVTPEFVAEIQAKVKEMASPEATPSLGANTGSIEDGEDAAAAEKQKQLEVLNAKLEVTRNQIKQLEAQITATKPNKQQPLKQQLAKLQQEYEALSKQLDDGSKD